jgi:hypothetical protein
MGRAGSGLQLFRIVLISPVEKDVCAVGIPSSS